MLDFIFRRGDPSNAWVRSDPLELHVALDKPAINGVELGVRFDRLSFLGRSRSRVETTLHYYDLGIEIEHEDGVFDWFTVIHEDDLHSSAPYTGELSWRGDRIALPQLQVDDLKSIFGEWYWLDTDDDETIVFYEFPDYEMQIEFTLAGTIKRFNLGRIPLMADAGVREDYNCTKPWPPDRDG